VETNTHEAIQKKGVFPVVPGKKRQVADTNGKFSKNNTIKFAFTPLISALSRCRTLLGELQDNGIFLNEKCAFFSPLEKFSTKSTSFSHKRSTGADEGPWWDGGILGVLGVTGGNLV